MKNNTVDVSILYSLSGSYYEQCCEISKNHDDSIKLVFYIFKNDATFQTRQGDINLNIKKTLNRRDTRKCFYRKNNV